MNFFLQNKKVLRYAREKDRGKREREGEQERVYLYTKEGHKWYTRNYHLVYYHTKVPL